MAPIDPASGPSHDAGGLQTLGRYRLLRLLGRGGMSEVYLGYDSRAGQPVAIKVMSERLAEDPRQMERFRRETLLTQKLHHPNIVRGLDAGKDAATKRRFLVLEYIDGPSAHTLLERHGKLDVNDAVHIALAAAAGLAYLHRRHFVHRDIKPENILLSPCGRAKIIDLGLVRWRTQDGAHLTATSDGLGTSYYMPPEQALNSHWVDGRSDIYALGATLYHLLTGVVPFPGDNHRQIMDLKEAGHYTPASLINPSVPAELELILNHMLARDPRQRYRSCQDLLTALKRARLTRGLPSFADLGQAVRSPQKKSPAPTPTRPDPRLRASKARSSRAGTEFWIIRYQNRDGNWAIRKATTAQLYSAVKSGRFTGPVFGARRPREKFRPLQDFPEFHSYFPQTPPVDAQPRMGLCGRLLARLGLGFLCAAAIVAVEAARHFLS